MQLFCKLAVVKVRVESVRSEQLLVRSLLYYVAVIQHKYVICISDRGKSVRDYEAGPSLPSCSGLPDEKNRVYFMSVENAESAGYEPCGRCHPDR